MPKHYFRDSTGKSIVSTVDGDIFTSEIEDQFTQSEVYFEFYSDEKGLIPVTPTGGEISTAGRPLNFIYVPATNDNIIGATTVSSPDATYTPPTMDGLVKQARIRLSGITGAPYMKAVLYGHN